MNSLRKLALVSMFLATLGMPAFSIDPLTITPDGHILVNANGVSIDLVEYLIPVGSIQPFAGSTPPQGWAFCNGHAVLSTEHQYDRLYVVIQTTFGNGSTEDGHAAGGYFNLPDLREAVPVGAGTRGTGVQNHDTYAVGDFRDDQLQNHTHGYFRVDGGGLSHGWTGGGASNGTTTGATGRVGAVTHGKQIGLNFIIKL